MEIKTWKCDICFLPSSSRTRMGELSLSGGTGGNNCNSKNYKDVCYYCTEKLFNFIKTIPKHPEV